MDTVDRQILALLVEDGRRTYDDIARHVALSAPAVKRRVDRLRASGALAGFTAVVDHAALGDQTEALVELFFAPGTLLDEGEGLFLEGLETIGVGKFAVRFKNRAHRTDVSQNIAFAATESFPGDANAGGFDLSSGSRQTKTFRTGPGVYQVTVTPGSDTAQWAIHVQDWY